MIERIAPATGPHPSGAYSPAVRAGNFLFISGQGPFDPDSDEVAAEDIAGQVRRTLENIGLLLSAVGATPAEVVRVDAYLASLDDFSAYDEVFGEFFGEHLPARTTTHSQLPGILVEINAIACLPE